MNLLFITRKYPPMVGGMENLSYALAKEFSKGANTSLITWGKSQKYLPLVILYFLIKAFYIIPAKKIDRLHIGDALLSPLALLLKTIFRVKTTITVVGLDVTFNFPGYQLVIPWCLSKMDKIICISNATLEECVKRGIPKEKCVVIPCGVYPNNFKSNSDLNQIEDVTGLKLKNKKILVTVGRLVKRKGVYWFISSVFPKLPSNIIYLIVGDGPEREKIQSYINANGYANRVILLGKISDEKLKIIYNNSDLFVMPNIEIPGTIEGFGIVAVEASATGLPVIASRLEGIPDAVIHGKTGIHVKPNSVENYISAITSKSIFSKALVANFTKEHFSWSIIGKRYIQTII